eukprot:scaffold206822_cov16-Prasinocladus_malaysianus.AAC.1
MDTDSYDTVDRRGQQQVVNARKKMFHARRAYLTLSLKHPPGHGILDSVSGMPVNGSPRCGLSCHQYRVPSIVAMFQITAA